MKLNASAYVAIFILLFTLAAVSYAVVLKWRDDNKAVTPPPAMPAPVVPPPTTEVFTARRRRR
jgi:hypothetical protein